MKPVESAFLVYQAGIANVFAVDCLNLSPFGREAVLLFQGDFRTAEGIARGLILAGVPVGLASCNWAGEIKEVPWTPGLDECPFRDQARPPKGVATFLGDAIDQLS